MGRLGAVSPSFVVFTRQRKNNLLKEQDVWLRFVYLIVLPSKTLSRCQQVHVYMCLFSARTCVIPSALHSSSHNNFSVPRAPSK